MHFLFDFSVTFDFIGCYQVYRFLNLLFNTLPAWFINKM